MSQYVSFSVSSNQLDGVREGLDDVISSLEEVAEGSGKIEYLNSQPTEYTEDIYEDIGYAQGLGLNPNTIHLSSLSDLAEEDGEVELNTSVRNSQISPSNAIRESYWDPENIVLHPPIVEPEDKRQSMRNVLENIYEVQELNKNDERISGRLLLENLPPIGDYMVQRPEDIRMVEREAEAMGIQEDINYVLDLGHTIDWKPMVDAIPTERVYEVHIHNKRQLESGRWDNHIPPYEGEIDVDEFLEFYNNELSHAEPVIELKPEHMSPEKIRKSREFVESRID